MDLGTQQVCPVVSHYWWQAHPPVGVFAIILAGLGVVVPWFRAGKTSKTENAIWTIVFFALLGLEVRTTYLDRNEQDAEHALQECEQRNQFAEQVKRFSDLNNELELSVETSKSQFQTTLRDIRSVYAKTGQAASTATNAVELITGGEGYCYIDLEEGSGFPTAKDQIYPFLYLRGSRVLRDVTMRVVDYPAYEADARNGRPFVTLQEFINGHAVSTSLGDLNEGGTPLLNPVGINTNRGSDKNYTIEFYALNGTWQEDLEYRLVNDRAEKAIRIRKVYYIGGFEVKNRHEKVVYEKVSPGFPTINGKVDWPPSDVPLGRK